MSKRAIRNQEFDLFIPRMGEMRLKDQREVMERPFFALSKRKRLKPIEYTSPDGDVWVHVSANPRFGIATIWDADILIWATSRLNQLRESGSNDIPRTIHTSAYELLRAIRRDTGGKGYKELEAALERLQSTVIETSIRAPKRNKRAQFGWLDEFVLETDPATGASKGISLTLSNWVYEGLLKERSLLTLHPDYFTLSGGLERAIYRIARKHAGDQPDGWVCRVSVLHEKTGSESPLKQFSYLLKKIVSADDLPDYALSHTTTRDGAAAIHFVRRDAAEKALLKASLAALSESEGRRAREDERAGEVDAMFARRRVSSGDQ
ncbi:replication initiator protein A [Phenylobacterium sp. LjRoot164]|uniref:replication initiator protein A n=1 Tax=unclassified Phenylobacterium TaxID=2640670 RepID=UPI003ED00B4E